MISLFPQAIYGQVRRSKTRREYSKRRSYTYFWQARFDGSIELPACHLKKTYSPYNHHAGRQWLKSTNPFTKKQGLKGDAAGGRHGKVRHSAQTALSIYAASSKFERSPRECPEQFYNAHRYWSLADLGAQLARRQCRSNSRATRPVYWHLRRQMLAFLAAHYIRQTLWAAPIQRARPMRQPHYSTSLNRNLPSFSSNWHTAPFFLQKADIDCTPRPWPSCRAMGSPLSSKAISPAQGFEISSITP